MASQRQRWWTAVEIREMFSQLSDSDEENIDSGDDASITSASDSDSCNGGYDVSDLHRFRNMEATNRPSLDQAGDQGRDRSSSPIPGPSNSSLQDVNSGRNRPWVISRHGRPSGLTQRSRPVPVDTGREVLRGETINDFDFNLPNESGVQGSLNKDSFALGLFFSMFTEEVIDALIRNINS